MTAGTRMATYDGSVSRLPEHRVLPVLDLLVLTSHDGDDRTEDAERLSRLAGGVPVVTLGPGDQLESLNEKQMRDLGWVRPDWWAPEQRKAALEGRDAG